MAPEGLHPVFLALYPVTRILKARRTAAIPFGRSSGSPAFSAAFPIRLPSDQWHTKAEKVPFPIFRKKRDYSGGTAPDFNEIPY